MEVHPSIPLYQSSLIRKKATFVLNFFELFWWAYALLSLVGIPLIIMYLSNGAIDYIYLFKVPLIGIFLILVAFHIKNRLRISPITILFGCFGFIGMIIGGVEGTLVTKPALVHVYMISISIMGSSLGYRMAAKDGIGMQRLIHRVMSFIFIISIFTLSTYFVLHFLAKSITYFGFDSYIPLVGAMFLADRKYLSFACAVLLVVLSGKRAPLVSMFAPLMLLQMKVLLRPRMESLIKNILIVAIVMAVLILVISNTGLADRWQLITSMDISDYDSIFRATSGRSVELIGLWNHLSSDPIRWIIGSGIGGEFIIDMLYNGEPIYLTQHFLHISIATYLLVFGTPFVLCLLYYITSVFWRNRHNSHTFWYIGMLVTFIGSFFGAGMIVEPIFWVFLGANEYFINHPKPRCRQDNYCRESMA